MVKKEMRTAIIILLGALVVVLILLRLFNIFPQPDKTAGTIGNVEKVDRFREKQLAFEDVKCDDEEVTKFVQSAQFQNLMKDENFRALLANPSQLEFVPMAISFAQITNQAAQNFNSFLEQGNNAQEFFGSAEYGKFYQIFKTSQTTSIPLLSGSSEGNYVMPSAQVIQNLVSNSHFQKMVENFDFKAFCNQDIQGIFGADFSNLLKGTLQATIGGIPANFDFNNAEFQKIYASQDIQKLFMSQDIQKLFESQDIIIFCSQDFEQFVKGAEFQNVLKNVVP